MKLTEAQARLAAYNDGLGDGLVYATAVMGNASNKIVKELRDEIGAKRRALAEQEGRDDE